MSNEEPKAEPKNAVDSSGTTDDDYRWKWLSTVWALFYGFAFPMWVFLSSVPTFPVKASAVGGELVGILTVVWAATVIYTIGPENVEAVKKLRGK